MSDESSQHQVIETLIKDLSRKDAMKCRSAREALVETGSPAVPHLIKALLTGKNWTRWESAKALGKIGDAEAVPALVEALRDKRFDVRWLAAKGLINIGWRSITPLIESLIQHADSVWMRDGSHHVLHALSHGQFNEPLQPIIKSLEGVEPAVVIPQVGRTVLEELKPIESLIIKEEEEARRRAEEEAEQAAAEAKLENDLEARLQKEPCPD